ncbi:MAG: indole-3-glycerol phosphate synthase TrpC [Candidatus Omnitrophica bacterium]|nr:indole-3-glycerol phosphate synthase TrpC [Candidatus Omnitrophota bacterium]
MFLDTIVHEKYKEIDKKKGACSLAALKQKTRDKRRVAGKFLTALRGSPGPRIIAEIKRRSPSKGVLREGIEVASLARTYEDSGACALSVLIDHRFFGGSIEDLEQAVQSVDIPVLYKDFIVTEYQVYEACAYGASAVLLIARILDDDTLLLLTTIARELGLDPLLEVHDTTDLERALKTNPSLIGVNNRNLDTFTVDITISKDLLPTVPEGIITVCESGIETAEDIHELSRQGADAFLIGESLLRHDNISAQLHALLGR